MKWTWLTATVALLAGLVAAPAALAAGGPVAPVQGAAIAAPGSADSYAAFAAGRDTVVKRLDRGATSELKLVGRYGVPGVDYSGTTTGLSADGRTLILAEIPRAYPPRATRLLVLAAAPYLAVRTVLTLRGWWTVDAISPDGRWLYLIQYRSTNLGDYAVRAYDLREHRLLAKPIVDPRERDEAMTGVPVNRVMSAGERWAYTLYFRPSGEPFVHALDTVHRRAVCVDLPSLANWDLGTGRLRLTPGGATLQVYVDSAIRARIDTRTFAVSTGAPTPPAPHVRRASSGSPWVLIALIIAAVGALVAVVTLPVRRHRPDDRAGSPGSRAPVPPEHDDTSAEPHRQPADTPFSR